MISRSRRRLRWPSAGFTLVEVLIVLAIMALATTLFMTGVRTGTTGAELREATREMTAALNEARSLAIAGNRVTALVIEQQPSLPRATRASIVLSPRVSIAVRASAASAGEGSGSAIYFFPDGSSSGGEIEFTAGTAREIVSVDWFTGHASAQELRTARAEGHRGFTLIEVLVAFAIAATLLVPLLRAFLRGDERARPRRSHRHGDARGRRPCSMRATARLPLVAGTEGDDLPAAIIGNVR